MPRYRGWLGSRNADEPFPAFATRSSDEELAALPALGLVACVRGGPVNVDIGAATRRGSDAIRLGHRARLVSVAKCVDLPDDGSVMPMNWA